MFRKVMICNAARVPAGMVADRGAAVAATFDEPGITFRSPGHRSGLWVTSPSPCGTAPC